MKKNLIIILSLLLTLGLFAQEYRDWSKWSVGVELGGNKFDGDVMMPYNAVIPTAFSKLSAGLQIERNWTPVWSTGLQYYYLPMEGGKHTPDGVKDYAFDANNNLIKGYFFNTKMHNLDLYMAFNLSKHFFKHSTSKWNLWTTLGLGGALYAVDYETIHGTSVPNNSGTPDHSTSFDDGATLYFPIGVLAEYNLTKHLALGAKMQYRFYGADNLEGRDLRGVSNDNVAIASLSLRYKFRAKSKDHLRNVNLATFNEDVTKEDLYRLHDQLNGIIIPVDNTDKLNDLDGRLKKLEDYLDINGPDDDGDGVPNSRDLEPDTKPDALVNFWGQTIPQGGGSTSLVIDESALIYFDFDKTNLDAEAHKAIELAASNLNADPELIVEVRGFTDNMGTDAYNAGLSQRRADVVKNELVKKYGIDPNRIVANGKGKYNPNDAKVPYRLYRTTVFFYNK